MVNIMNTGSTREYAGKKILELGGTNSDLCVVGADLNKSTFTNMFADKYPDRFFDVGIAEQNMVNIAAGLAASGKIPIVSTFAVFGSTRPMDQLRVGVSQPNLNVKVILTHAGLITGEDGISAQSLEDLSLFLSLNAFSILVPSDAYEAQAAVELAINTNGPFYIRLSRPAIPIINKSDIKLEHGGSNIMYEEGNDVSILCYGYMVYHAIEAAKILNEKHGIKARVVNMYSLRPLDESIVLKCSKDSDFILTAEEHFKYGGLHSLVSQYLAENNPRKVLSISMNDYAESGTTEELVNKYGLNADNIVKTIISNT
jgi:transketolase